MVFDNHPDRGGDEIKIKSINNAYNLLREEIKNRLYIETQTNEFLEYIISCIMEDDLTSW